MLLKQLVINASLRRRLNFDFQEVGKTFLSLEKARHHIFDTNFICKDIWKPVDFFTGFQTLQMLYFNSIIDRKEFDKACAWVSYKTCNNLDVINKMPYYAFNNHLIFLKEIIEEESKQQGNEENSNQDVSQNFNSLMRQGKSMMPTYGNKTKFPKH